ncbi:unnamed protein product, partial [Phaeothamnion confervicola]
VITSGSRTADIPLLQPLPSLADVTNTPADPSALVLSQWMRGWERQKDSWSSNSLYMELKLREIQRITSRLDTPNSFRTVVCCVCLYKLCGSMGRLSVPFRALAMELFAAVFVDFAAGSAE